MTTTLFTDAWTFRREGESTEEAVRLPHDAMIGETRSGDALTGNHGGYFPGGIYVYAKQWTVPNDAADVSYLLFFEGVYGTTRVLVDGREIGGCDSGYREFAAPLDGLTPGRVVTIEVHVDNSDVPNSRWYTGSGIYRPVWLEATGALRIARDGVHVTTRSIKAADSAQVDVTVRLEGEVPRSATVSVEFADADGTVVAQQSAPVPSSGGVTVPLQLRNVQLWSAESPHLYEVAVYVAVDGEVVERRRIRTGVRTVQVDVEQGLRINGETVLLRGACVHHDNGILGAATFAAADYRRARLLKEVGFNAIRSSHNPLSRAFLDACDELGLYVMDELTDVWLGHKTPHDGADRFEQTWEADAAAMIAKDRNRPSVIMYSIGNEIAETATPVGVDAARRIDRYFAANDPTRPTTLAVNLLLNLMASRGSSAFDREEYTGGKKPKKKEATSTVANMLTARLGSIMNLVSRLPAADRASRGAFDAVNIAGYNYAYGRYESDRKKYPQRVIVGSESMPGDLPAIWKRVTSVPGVIGDFMWTGWDYLGEAGIGVWSYGDESGSINKPYPALVAGSGAFDITGIPGAPALLASAVWDTADGPAIAVRPLDLGGRRANKSPWRSTDAITSWSWQGLTGKADIQVFSADDEVELHLNGRSLGRKKTGPRMAFTARFRAVYEPGELVAVGYREGRETSRAAIRTAREISIRLRSETPTIAGPDDLAYVWVELADDQETVDSHASDLVSVSVTGAATLLGLGTSAPITEESFTDQQHTTHRGRALAIIRGTSEAGTITVKVTSKRHGSATLELENEHAHRTYLNASPSRAADGLAQR